jgi:hypothetical protein
MAKQKWNLTANQWQAMDNVLTMLVDIIEKSNAPNVPTVLIKKELISRIAEKLKVKLPSMRLNPNVVLRLELSYLEALCFFEIISHIPIDESDTSLEIIIATQICRDIHQKLLT